MKHQWILLYITISANLLLNPFHLFGQHYPGEDCFTCHSNFKVAGTIFTDTNAFAIEPGVIFKLTKPNGNKVILDPSDENGNIYNELVENGNYLLTVGNMTSRTWHTIPEQGSCNSCHIIGGNASGTKTKVFTPWHTQIPPDNDCAYCHHFPASMDISQLATMGVLNIQSTPLDPPGSAVIINGIEYPFDSSSFEITSVRPDVFAPGFFSMFDVILAVGQENNISIDYAYDESRKTHFISEINNDPGNYWYHFSYDAGPQTMGELSTKRANRWDETLWRPGAYVSVVEGENLAEIKEEYVEEIERENLMGNVIPHVEISINPSNYMGNPPGSGRITVNQTFENVEVSAHDHRATGFPTPYSKPFQPGVITSIDMLYSLVDQGHLTLVTDVFYSRFSNRHIDSYYVVAMGFPGIGEAHASGRHGFVYVTENGSFGNLPNNANNTFHITSDISVIHAPDFSRWYWIELGNPYYEDENPLTTTNPTIEEDFNAIERGFNLHNPFPNPFNDHLKISFNVFNSALINIDIVDQNGQFVESLYNSLPGYIGVHELNWKPFGIVPGSYYIVMRYRNHQQVRRVQYIK